MASASSSWYDKMTKLSNTFCLTQIVSEITHVHHNGTDTLFDQVFMSHVQLYCRNVLNQSFHSLETQTTGVFTIANSIKNKVKHYYMDVTAESIVWRYAHAA